MMGEAAGRNAAGVNYIIVSELCSISYWCRRPLIT